MPVRAILERGGFLDGVNPGSRVRAYYDKNDKSGRLARGRRGDGQAPPDGRREASTRKRLLAVYWGRFNPPHRGHLDVVRRFRRKYRLVVVVGSAEFHDTDRNPFRGSERVAMWEAYLRETGIRDVGVVALRDGTGPVTGAIARLVERLHPDLLLLSTEKNALSNLARTTVRVVGFPRASTPSSTMIREAIVRGDGRWKRWTGKSVADLIEQFDGPARIKKASSRDREARSLKRSRPRVPLRPSSRRRVPGPGSRIPRA